MRPITDDKLYYFQAFDHESKQWHTVEKPDIYRTTRKVLIDRAKPIKEGQKFLTRCPSARSARTFLETQAFADAFAAHIVAKGIKVVHIYTEYCDMHRALDKALTRLKWSGVYVEVDPATQFGPTPDTGAPAYVAELQASI